MLKFSKFLMRLIPVIAIAGFSQQWHVQLNSVLHQLYKSALVIGERRRTDFKHQFIVHLHDHQDLCRILLLQIGVHTEHGAFDNISGSALHRSVDRCTFCAFAPAHIFTLDLRQI